MSQYVASTGQTLVSRRARQTCPCPDPKNDPPDKPHIRMQRKLCGVVLAAAVAGVPCAVVAPHMSLFRWHMYVMCTNARGLFSGHAMATVRCLPQSQVVRVRRGSLTHMHIMSEGPPEVPQGLQDKCLAVSHQVFEEHHVIAQVGAHHVFFVWRIWCCRIRRSIVSTVAAGPPCSIPNRWVQPSQNDQMHIELPASSADGSQSSGADDDVSPRAYLQLPPPPHRITFAISIPSRCPLRRCMPIPCKLRHQRPRHLRRRLGCRRMSRPCVNTRPTRLPRGHPSRVRWRTFICRFWCIWRICFCFQL